MVVINGNRITFVSRSASAPLARTRSVHRRARPISIPGLWECTCIPLLANWFPGGREIILPLFIANGVTGVRDMAETIPVLSAGVRKSLTE